MDVEIGLKNSWDIPETKIKKHERIKRHGNEKCYVNQNL